MARYFTRREILVGMGAAGLTPLLFPGCGSSGPPSLPDNLPVYEWDDPAGPENLFEHGVASGDPLSDAVIIWTRVSPEAPASSEPVDVFWEMALDEEFSQRTAAGTVMTDDSRDFTVKVNVPGLVWGRNYFYRFAAQGRWSPIGRTRLAPKGDQASQLRFGVCACSSYGRGWFHGYRHMAERADLDAVVHLGDYTYEYGNEDLATPFLRMVEPPHETVTLEDYRIRLSQHRRDPDLQECHRQHPFIVVWDDHETANDSWMGGAQNHDPAKEGSWEDRLAAARQAFFEWIPLRERADQQIYRTMNYGDLADIIMLDTRIEGREKQFPSMFTFPADEPNLPKNIISAQQEAWLQDQLTTGTAKWKIIGNQVVMGLLQTTNPDGSKMNVRPDQWHGYREGRERLLTFFRDNDISNAVIVSGDIHSSWAIDVRFGDGSYNPETREGALCGEFVAPAITAPHSELVAPLVDRFGPSIRYYEGERKGYFVLDVQADKVQADWYLLDGVEQNQGNESLDASWAVLDGEKHVVEMSGPETPNGDVPPPAS